MPFRKLIVICVLTLAVVVGAFTWISRQTVGATLTLPDGSQLIYHDVTVEPYSPRAGTNVVVVRHVLPEQLPWHWRWARHLPAEAHSFFGVPSPSPQESYMCANDHALWFHFTGPEITERFRFFLADAQGYESEIVDTGFNHPMVMLAGAGPRRSKHLRIAVREKGPVRLGAPLSVPMASATMRNPLRSAGPSLPELDPLPATKTVEGFDVTLHKLVRRKEVSRTSGGMEIHWSIRRHGLLRAGWKMATPFAGMFFDGGNSSTPIVTLTTGQPVAICGSALFSDDPVWLVKLQLQRTNENMLGFDSVLKLTDLPVPDPEQTLTLHRVTKTPPWDFQVVTVSRNYTLGAGKDLISVLMENSKSHSDDLPRVLNSDAKLHTTFWKMGFGRGQWLFEVPEGRKTWDLEIVIDRPIDVQFQSRVEFQQ